MYSHRKNNYNNHNTVTVYSLATLRFGNYNYVCVFINYNNFIIRTVERLFN